MPRLWLKKWKKKKAKLKPKAKKPAKRPLPKNKNSRPMKPYVIMGLGNPGPMYEQTRHNVGYHVTDLLLQEPPVRLRRRLFASYLYYLRKGIPGERPLLFVRSTGYMNNSGDIVPSIMHRYETTPGDFIVILDNMDLQPGKCRLKKGGGDAGHNGLKSLIRRMGSSDFHRLYIGVGRPASGVSVVDHVLGNPEPEEQELIMQACEKAATALRSLGYKPLERVMEELNRREH
jgi:PTH1 family peptidyl-tRNA hydrolase